MTFCCYRLDSGEFCGAEREEHGPLAEYDYLQNHEWLYEP